MTPPDRARLLDAEMQLQRAWLELSVRDLTGTGRHSVWARLRPLKLGMSLLKHRSLWLAAISLFVNLYRRHASKEKA